MWERDTKLNAKSPKIYKVYNSLKGLSVCIIPTYMHEPKSMNTDTRIHEYIQKYIQM